MTVRAVFLDLFNTLVGFQPEREEVQRQVCRQFGIDLPLETLRRVYATVENQRAPRSRHTSGVLAEIAALDSWVEFQYRLLHSAGIAVSAGLAAQISEQYQAVKRRLVVYDDVVPALAMLRERRLILGLISSAQRPVATIIPDPQVLDSFDFVVTSAELDAEKPDPRIFAAALRRAGVQASEAMHVGDQYTNDLVGARDAGLQAVLLDRHGLWAELDCPRIGSLLDLPGFLAGLNPGSDGSAP